MITNFDYLKNEEKFKAFADVAVSAEKIILIDPEACVINCRRAMEFAVKWMYSVEKQLDMPYQDNLQSLINAEDFRDIVGYDIWKRMDYIRRCGNNVAHNRKRLVGQRQCFAWKTWQFILILLHVVILRIIQNIFLISS